MSEQKIDYEALLQKYIDHTRNATGYDLLTRSSREYSRECLMSVEFTDEEWAELLDMAGTDQEETG